MWGEEEGSLGGNLHFGHPSFECRYQLNAVPHRYVHYFKPVEVTLGDVTAVDTFY